ncbi:MAG: acyltransferase [Microthrixaceae bacterium]|nr:acyltransferase [Microthrixaceae bacterium]
MASPVSAGGAHRRDIQGLRGVAVLLVVAFHARIGPRGGFVGVDVFLVISGFVIGRGLIDERIRTGTVRLRSFYARRVRRLLPAMAVFTVTTAIVGALVLSPFGDQQRVLSTGMAATVFLANVQLYRTTGYFDGSADRNPFLHTWSLSLEEQFYALLPLALMFTWWLARCRGDRRNPTTNRPFGAREVALVAVVGLGAMSLVLSILLTSGLVGFALEAPQRLVFFSMPTRIWQFSAGVVLAVTGLPSGRVGTRTAGIVGLGALMALLGVAVVVDPLAPHMSLWTVLVVAAAVVVIMTATPDGPGTRLLSSPPLVWVGDRSYGWYLWHWPFVVFAGVLWPDRPGVLVLAAVVSLAPTELSYRFVERRFRFGAQWVGPRTVGLAAVCILVPLLVLVDFAWPPTGAWGSRSPLTGMTFHRHTAPIAI